MVLQSEGAEQPPEAQEPWLTRYWRPLLMAMLMGFLLLAGLVLPFAELLSGHRIALRPKWELIPPEFWNLLTIGMGGYIGGRSAEKIAWTVSGRPNLPERPKQNSM